MLKSTGMTRGNKTYWNSNTKSLFCMEIIVSCVFCFFFKWNPYNYLVYKLFCRKHSSKKFEKYGGPEKNSNLIKDRLLCCHLDGLESSGMASYM